MNNVKHVRVRSEGDVNGFFLVTHPDGTVSEYWSCDQGPIQSTKDDTYLEDHDPELARFLMDLWAGMDIPAGSHKTHITSFDPQGKVMRVWA